jgi:hypothetical protein
MLYILNINKFIGLQNLEYFIDRRVDISNIQNSLHK